MANEKKTKELCGVKFELKTAMCKMHREIIDKAAKRNKMYNIILPKGEDTFIVTFESRLNRDGFVTAITPYLYGDIPYSYVNSIKVEG